MISKLIGFRKVLVVVSVLALTTALLLGNIITGDQYVEIIKFVLPSFFAASLGEALLKPKAKDQKVVIEGE